MFVKLQCLIKMKRQTKRFTCEACVFFPPFKVNLRVDGDDGGRKVSLRFNLQSALMLHLSLAFNYGIELIYRADIPVIELSD